MSIRANIWIGIMSAFICGLILYSWERNDYAKSIKRWMRYGAPSAWVNEDQLELSCAGAATRPATQPVNAISDQADDDSD